ncbi:MAG: polysaccharide deacetylase family protein [Cellvibrionaceae bacterium]|nr:polysaccharide deacetylase family protein [Cellvibrionaceae bacterium]
MHAIVTVHDVMPEVLGKIAHILQLIPAQHRSAVCLLVVPGLAWQSQQLEQLRQWQDQGFELAGHGWTHRAERIGSVYHRFHSLFISRRCAEHLSLSRQQIKALVQANYRWFERQGFKAPQLYVPPAWALGRLTKTDLEQLPYPYYENTAGIYQVASGQQCRLPLAGFEADTLLRAYFLRLWNKLNARLSHAHKPLRISIHPHDLDYRLAGDIRQILSEISVWRNYQSLAAHTPSD